MARIKWSSSPYDDEVDIYYYCENDECSFSILEVGVESDEVQVHDEPCPRCGDKVSTSEPYERDDYEYEGRTCDDYDYDIASRIR
jgi:hypothetical protein